MRGGCSIVGAALGVVVAASDLSNRGRSYCGSSDRYLECRCRQVKVQPWASTKEFDKPDESDARAAL